MITLDIQNEKAFLQEVAELEALGDARTAELLRYLLRRINNCDAQAFNNECAIEDSKKKGRTYY